ncbi:hypothetical protein D9756_007259 [Leucocoprinus leucothites]|uniref:RecA family profile 1 domain-containing protein n=1 Tax=Leucocoprinus leucothites TaxID=201217 RepID=A0A8H5D6F9_9AGAR|nr:hypothetical protein D9756_007259 [Leucoagaricus leucothites]
MSARPILSLRLSKATKDALYKNGYETVQDLLSTPSASIARDLNISTAEAEDILQQAQNPSTQHPGVPNSLTRSLAMIVNSTRKFTTRWPPLDKLLKGGLVHGHILEISGPPGCPKETIAIDITFSVLQAGEKAIFVDCQNMTSISDLRKQLIHSAAGSTAATTTTTLLSSLHFTRILNATELMVFLHSINTILDSMPKVSLLVLNSLSFPFSTLPNPRLKSGILEQVKHILTQVSAVRNVTVVITSQLATIMLKEDGSRGTFDEGAKGMMTPQLGPSYLPPGRSHRVILSLESPVAGTMYLLPNTKQASNAKQPVQQEAYSFPQTPPR